MPIIKDELKSFHICWNVYILMDHETDLKTDQKKNLHENFL